MSPRLAAALNALEGDDGHQVEHLHRIIRDRSTADDVWLTMLGRHHAEAVVITADINIYRNPALKEAWLRSGLTVVFLKSFTGHPHWDQAAKIVKWWPTITDAARRARPGSGLIVTANGKIEPFEDRFRKIVLDNP